MESDKIFTAIVKPAYGKPRSRLLSLIEPGLAMVIGFGYTLRWSKTKRKWVA